MPLTNYNFGVSSFGMPVIGSFPYMTVGSVFFVKASTGNNSPGRGTDPTTPFASIAYALTFCVANRGDLILVLPGHTESITGAAGWTSIAGVTVVGLGTGASRPTITLGTAITAQIVVSAANFRMHNLIIDMTGFDAITAGIAVTGTDFEMRNCRVVIGGANQAVLGVSLGAGSDRAAFIACEFISSAAGSTAAIQGVVANDGLKVRDCLFNGDFTACINNTTVAWTNIFIDRNHFYCLGSAKSIILVATTTGIIRDNVSYITANIAAGGSMTAAGAAKFGNYAVENAQIATSAIVDPAATGIA